MDLNLIFNLLTRHPGWRVMINYGPIGVTENVMWIEIITPTDYHYRFAVDKLHRNDNGYLDFCLAEAQYTLSQPGKQ